MLHFISFKTTLNKVQIPSEFPYPFYYQPDELAKIAVKELQDYLINTSDLQHNFGLNPNKKGKAIGKMFGVLVVKNQAGELGYLAAFSGNLANENNTKLFVPAIVALFDANGFYAKGKAQLMQISEQINALEKNKKFIELQQVVTKHEVRTNKLIALEKEKISKRKQLRKKAKQQAHLLSKTALAKQQAQFAQDNINEKFYLSELANYYTEQIAKEQVALNHYKTQVKELRAKQVALSNSLSEQIAASYQFYNQKQEQKSLTTIFKEWEKAIPAGAGDCAAPKLLQYAFANQLEPITMAEFWWGKSEDGIIRKHEHYYPSCRGKCEPILGHMLQKTKVAKNPLIINQGKGKTLETLYEDAAILVINKPSGLLSVPGKTIKDSVYTRIKAQYPEATGPLLVHRLDMDTSGILLIAKTEESYKNLQQQFIKRTVKKCYTAVLAGKLQEQKGKIDLPLRVDLNDRPKQLVCYEHGKKALTYWELITSNNNTSLVYFYPVTGRTHQLRVHAAHPKGLNTAILGDDLYGTKANRLHLHAAFIAFKHPISAKKMVFEVKADFSV